MLPTRFVVPARSAAAELLAALAPVLEAWGRRWYVFGAQAVVAYGFPRLTADVDVTAELTPDDPHGFVDAMRSAGFALRVQNIDDFVGRTRVLPFVHDPTGMPLDVVLAGSGLEREFIDRATPHERTSGHSLCYESLPDNEDCSWQAANRMS